MNRQEFLDHLRSIGVAKIVRLDSELWGLPDAPKHLPPDREIRARGLELDAEEQRHAWAFKLVGIDLASVTAQPRMDSGRVARRG